MHFSNVTYVCLTYFQDGKIAIDADTEEVLFLFTTPDVFDDSVNLLEICQHPSTGMFFSVFDTFDIY